MTTPEHVTGGTPSPAHWSDERLRHAQRRTLGSLVVAQSFGGLGIAVGVAVAAILAEELSGSVRLAGLVQTMQVLGTAFASYLLSHLMGRRGRRPGLALGLLIGATGAGLCVAAGVVGSFALLLVGAALLGSTTAVNNLSRYAATDLARPDRRARSLSIVVWATTFGAVLGPNVTGVAGRVARGLGLPPLTGPFLFSAVAILVAALVVSVFLRPDPLLLAKETALARGDTVTRTGTAWSHVRRVARTNVGVQAGVAALALGHAVMIAVMVMTPLHMHHGGATLQVIGVVISVHILGMFFFAPVVGWAADRVGRPPVMATGAAVLLASVLLSGTAPEGASVRIGLGLFLLGLGWSFTTVAASTLLSESAPLESRTDVQGAADLTMGVVAAAAGALAGVIMGWLGFGALNIFAGVLAGGVALAALLARRTPTPADALTDL